jgi:hypothetical protein
MNCGGFVPVGTSIGGPLGSTAGGAVVPVGDGEELPLGEGSAATGEVGSPVGVAPSFFEEEQPLIKMAATTPTAQRKRVRLT